MKDCILTLILILLGFSGHAQNIAGNPSFEEYHYCPWNHSSVWGPHEENTVKRWHRANYGSTDYFNVCGASYKCRVPDNFLGYQPARTGDAYGGIIIGNYSAPGEVSNYREYLQNRLTRPLVAGHRYFAAFWHASGYNSDDYSQGILRGAIDRLGILFSTDSMLGPYYGAITDHPPAIESPAGIPLDNTVEWMQLSGTFTASGGERWMTIGCFRESAELSFTVLPHLAELPVGSGAYYFIEDACLLDLDGEPDASDTHYFEICEGNSLVLSGPVGDQYVYEWSNGSNAPEITVSAAGTYWLRSVDRDSCRLRTDTFAVSYISFDPVPLLTEDRICATDSILLSIDSLAAYQSVLWSNGATTAATVAATSGTYYVTVSTTCMVLTDSVTVSVLPVYIPQLRDTTLCKGAVLDLSVTHPDATFSWSNGHFGCCTRVNESGTYRVRIQDSCGHIFYDSVRVSFPDCDQCFAFPDAFSPNGDALNEVFRPLVYCNILEYHLQIFDRWGNLVFTTNTPGQGWDGYYPGGGKAELGVYFYMLSASTSQVPGKIRVYKGDLTLLR